jgi:hypothetical protein
MAKDVPKHDWRTKWKKTFLKRRIQLEDWWQPKVISCISQDEYYRTH